MYLGSGGSLVPFVGRTFVFLNKWFLVHYSRCLLNISNFGYLYYKFPVISFVNSLTQPFRVHEIGCCCKSHVFACMWGYWKSFRSWPFYTFLLNFVIVFLQSSVSWLVLFYESHSLVFVLEILLELKIYSCNMFSISFESLLSMTGSLLKSLFHRSWLFCHNCASYLFWLFQVWSRLLNFFKIIGTERNDMFLFIFLMERFPESCDYLWR